MRAWIVTLAVGCGGTKAAPPATVTPRPAPAAEEPAQPPSEPPPEEEELTLGTGAGPGTGQGIGGSLMVVGNLPKEVVQRVIAQKAKRFDKCYQEGKASNPVLAGRVSARFTITGEGTVTRLVNGGSNIVDKGVIECVVKSFADLRFPKPTTGVVSVVYHVTLKP